MQNKKFNNRTYYRGLQAIMSVEPYHRFEDGFYSSYITIYEIVTKSVMLEINKP